MSSIVEDHKAEFLLKACMIDSTTGWRILYAVMMEGHFQALLSWTLAKLQQAGKQVRGVLASMTLL